MCYYFTYRILNAIVILFFIHITLVIHSSVFHLYIKFDGMWKIPSKNSNKTITIDCSIRVYHMSFTYNYTQSKIYYSYGTDILHFIVRLFLLFQALIK